MTVHTDRCTDIGLKSRFTEGCTYNEALQYRVRFSMEDNR